MILTANPEHSPQVEGDDARALPGARTYMPIEQRRALLVEAALRVMVEHGIEAATTRAIAKEAGVPLGLLHYCYANKDDLLADAYLHVADQVAALSIKEGDDVEGLLADYRDGGPAALQHLVETAIELYWDLVTEDVRTEYACLELERHLAAVGRTDLVTRLVDSTTASLAGTLDNFATVTGMRWTLPVEVLAASANAAIDGALRRRVSTGDVQRHRQTLDIFGRLLSTLAEPAAG